MLPSIFIRYTTSFHYSTSSTLLNQFLRHPIPSKQDLRPNPDPIFHQPIQFVPQETISPTDKTSLQKEYEQGIQLFCQSKRSAKESAYSLFLNGSKKGFTKSMNALATFLEGGYFLWQDRKHIDFGEIASLWTRSAQLDDPAGSLWIYLSQLYSSIPEQIHPDEIVSKLELRIKSSNDVLDHYLLGWAHHLGVSGQRQPLKALHHWSIGAEQGFPPAQVQAALQYQEDSNGIPQDHALMFDLLHKAADHGDSLAQMNLGYFYRKGIGCEKNVTESFRFISLAADQGSGFAQIAKADSYKMGLGISVNPNLAFHYYHLAADQGIGHAYNELGMCYEKGIGVDSDIDKAATYFEKGSRAGDLAAQHNFAVYLLEQYENETNHSVKSESTLHRSDSEPSIQSTQTSDSNTSVFTNPIKSSSNDPIHISKPLKKAIKLLKQGAEANFSYSQTLLGQLYLTGRAAPLVPQDVQKAFILWDRAGKSNDTDALVNLGVALYRGIEGQYEPNPTAAFLPLETAAILGSSEAKYWLAHWMITNPESSDTESISRIDKLLTAAQDQGLLEAYFLLGSVYYTGISGFPVDKAKAVSIFSQGGYQNSAKCSRALVDYYNSIGDPDNAKDWQERLDEQTTKLPPIPQKEKTAPFTGNWFEEFLGRLNS